MSLSHNNPRKFKLKILEPSTGITSTPLKNYKKTIPEKIISNNPHDRLSALMKIPNHHEDLEFSSFVL